MITWTPELQAWAALATAVVGALVLLYLLKPRRRQVQVPYAGLWRQVLARHDAQLLGRRWQRLLSWLLMVGIAGLLLGALQDALWTPSHQGPPPRRGSTVIVLDLSASMATDDGLLGDNRVSRLAEAQEGVRRLVENSPSDEDLLLATASGHLQVRAGWGTDRRHLIAQLEGLQATHGGLDLAQVFTRAAQILAGRPGGRLIVVSDGGPPLQASASGKLEVQWLWVGPARAVPQPIPTAVTEGEGAAPWPPFDNLAIEEVRIRPLAQDPDRGTLTVKMRNDTKHVQPAKLLVSASAQARTPSELSADRNLRRLVEVDLPPGATLLQVEDLDLVDARFGVRIQTRAANFVDRAAWDDWGLAVLHQQRSLSVLWVGPPNAWLQAALGASGRAQVRHLDPAGYRPAEWRADDRARHGVDLVVLDQAGQEPPEGMPALQLALAPPAESTATAMLARNPEVLVRAGDHPAMRGVSFQDTNFDVVRVLPLAQGDRVLAAATLGGARSGPVMVASEWPARRLRWGLDLGETDLVARYALPILVHNALAWLAGEEVASPAPLELGRPWAVDLPNLRGDWQYAEPGAAERQARLSAGQALGSSEVLGLHQWRDGSGATVLRAARLPPSEQPRLGVRQGVAVQQRVGVERLPVHKDDIPRPLRWVLGALIVLAAEWLLYVRRRTV